MILSHEVNMSYPEKRLPKVIKRAFLSNKKKQKGPMGKYDNNHRQDQNKKQDCAHD